MPHQYITNQEFADAPTGLNLTNLIPSGTTAQEQEAISKLLQRASAIVDRHCYQSLYAHNWTEIQRLWPDNVGNLVIKTNYLPVTAVSSVQIQTSPQASYTPVTLTNVLIDPGIYPQLVRVYGCYGYYKAWDRLIAQITYTAGFVSTALSTTVLQGAQTITVVDTSGITAGLPISLYDSQDSEDVVVQSVNGLTITLTAPVAYTHNAGVGVSTVPEGVKQAVIMIATFLLNERSTGEIDMGFGNAAPMVGKVKNTNEYELALDLLQPFRRVL